MPHSPSDNTGCHDIRAFGAVGDGHTLDTPAIQQAIDACHSAGGGMVLAPPGTYLTGTIFLKSNVTLHLMAGATLRGSPRREDYNPDDVFPENPVFSRENVTGAHLVIAYRAENVAITGQGTIDGNSAAFFEPLPAEEMTASYQRRARTFPIRDWRPGQMVFFCRCTNVTVRDVSLINAPYWTLFFLGCRSVQARGLRITNPPQTPNGDGIDIDCTRDATVSDCIIHSGDDCITLRGYNKRLGDDAPPCENVVVSNCVVSTPCTGFRIGVGDGIVRDCAISNIVVKETRTGINFICAYSDVAAHGVTIENIRFSNIVMDTVVPLNVLLGQSAKPPAAIRDVSFSHLRAIGRQGSYIGGHPGHPLADIHLHEVDLRLTGGEDVAPDFAQRTPMPWGENRIAAGLLVRHVEGLRISGLRVDWRDIRGPWQEALIIEDSPGAVLEGVVAPAPPGVAG